MKKQRGWLFQTDVLTKIHLNKGKVLWKFEWSMNIKFYMKKKPPSKV